MTRTPEQIEMANKPIRTPYVARFASDICVLFKKRGIMWFEIGIGSTLPDAWQNAKRTDFRISNHVSAIDISTIRGI